MSEKYGELFGEYLGNLLGISLKNGLAHLLGMDEEYIEENLIKELEENNLQTGIKLGTHVIKDFIKYLKERNEEKKKNK